MKKTITLSNFLLGASSLVGAKNKSGKSSKSNTSIRPSSSSSKGKESNGNKLTTFVVPDTQIEGKVSSDRNMRIDGKLIGEINCTAKIVVGETGEIEGVVHADSIIIDGTVNGDVFVKEDVHLGPKAIVNGSVKSGRISIELGAKINGTIQISPS